MSLTNVPTWAGSIHFFLILKFKFIDFEKMKFKFIDFKKTKFKFKFMKNLGADSKFKIQIQSNLPVTSILTSVATHQPPLLIPYLV